MTFKYIDPKDKDFNPLNPDINVKGYGVYKRVDLRKVVSGLIKSLQSAAQKYTSSDKPQYDIVKGLIMSLDKNSKLLSFIKADIGAMDELEALRKQGGQRKEEIPRQD